MTDCENRRGSSDCGAVKAFSFTTQGKPRMRRRYLRFKKRVLLKMIYALAAVLRFLK